MNGLLRVLVHPVFLSALGTAALAVLIWLIGPLLRVGALQPLDGVAERIAAIAVLFALWSLRQVFRVWRVRRNNRAILDGLVSERAQSTPEETASKEELAELQQRFEEALKILKTRPMSRRLGRGYLYETPWYMLIGPPGSGKTTLLRNSGLRFPLAEQLGDVKLRGVGGTRNCDWWFADKAVFLDTAGRYTTQDSYEAADRSAWLGFLGLLKRHRRRRPINGALVMVSVAELVRQTEAERARHAQAIRQRIQELHEQLGIRFPIYLVFTKADLLAGFTEFFADLDRGGREQVWGMTLPLEEPRVGRGPVDRFPSEFDQLVGRLESRVPKRLQEELDPTRRALAFAFPEQFAGLRELLHGFLDEAFQPSRFEVPAQLRGVYFTSATQEGSPIDRFVAGVAASLGLQRQGLPTFAGHGQSFFVTRLLRDVVLREAGLAGANLRLESRRRWIARVAVVSILALSVGIGAFVGLRYMDNRQLAIETAQAIARIDGALGAPRPSVAGLLDLLPVLDRLRDLAALQAHPAGLGTTLLPGLDQRAKLAFAARRSYERALYALLLPQVQLRLEDQMRRALSDPDRLYETLRVYLMFYEPSHRDPETMATWVALDWRRALPPRTTGDQREALQSHLRAALDLLARVEPPLPRNDRLVAEARRSLARLPRDERIYRAILESRFTQRLPAFDPAAAAGPDAAIVFKRASGRPLNEGVPGLFTIQGYRAFAARAAALVGRLAAERWILGQEGVHPDGPSLQRLQLQVRERYARDYIRHWDALIGDIEVVPLRGLTQAREVLRILTAADSPLRQLLEAIAHETMPAAQTRVSGTGGKAEDEQAATGLRARLSRLFGEAVEPAASDAPTRPVEAVDRHFERLHRLVLAPEGGRAPLERILARLEELYLYIDAIANAADRGEEALRVARERARGSDVIQRLRAEADRLPQPVQRWVKTLSTSSTRVLGGQVRGRINQAWAGDVLPFCRRAIAGRYPIVADAALEITLEDFARFFGPGGLMDRFFQDYLASFVDTTRHPWRVKARSGAAALSRSGLRQFENAERIRRAFFAGEGRRVEVPFVLTPLALDPQVRRFVLDLDGQRVEYRHGPPRSFELAWPGPQSTQRARIVFETLAHQERRRTFSGPWAWFRLIDESALEPNGAPDRFRLRFGLDGLEATFGLQAESVDNPFNLAALHEFQCIDRL